MAEVTFTYPAPDGETYEPDAFDGLIGLADTLKRSRDETYPITVVGMAVAGNGLSVEITLETEAVLKPTEEALIGFALTRRRAV